MCMKLKVAARMTRNKNMICGGADGIPLLYFHQTSWTPFRYPKYPTRSDTFEVATIMYYIPNKDHLLRRPQPALVEAETSKPTSESVVKASTRPSNADQAHSSYIRHITRCIASSLIQQLTFQQSPPRKGNKRFFLRILRILQLSFYLRTLTYIYPRCSMFYSYE